MDLQKTFDRPHITEDYTLTPLDLKEFYPELLSIIWVIDLKDENRRANSKTSCATGFAVDSNGAVLTCSHIFGKNAIGGGIPVRRLNDEGFCFQADIVYVRPKWDLALLRVRGATNCNFGRFAFDESIFPGDMLLHIGHPENQLVGSLLIGKAAYKSQNVVVPTRSQSCNSYTSTAHERTPDYRVMGHIWNVLSLGPSRQFEKNLDALVPIIQVYGLGGGEGCFGGPLLNTRGEIVGMMVLNIDGYQIAIHVTMLKHFLNEAGWNIVGQNLKRDLAYYKEEAAHDKEAGGSKKLKGH